jgi:hypothetical protein
VLALRQQQSQISLDSARLNLEVATSKMWIDNTTAHSNVVSIDEQYVTSFAAPADGTALMGIQDR